jgi:SAM-dependent methyltransferase
LLSRPRAAYLRPIHPPIYRDFLSQDESQQPQRTRRANFERLYATQAEPWTYSARAAEVMRHDHVEETIRGLKPRYDRILDIGCSVGQLTSRLAGLSPRVQGMDVSPTAVRRARERCDAAAERSAGARTAFRFCLGSSIDTPFRDGLFDLVLMCDGLHSWRLTPEEQARSLEQAHRILVPGGYAIFTEHLRPANFDAIIDRIKASPLEVVSVRYLHNRLWYSMERNLSRFRDRRSVQALLASRRVARGLMAVASLAGRRGAKHLCVIAQKAPERTRG